MNWRGEISVVAGDESYDFGPIGLGDTDKEIITPTDENIDVAAISNGNYELNSLSDVKWYSTSPVDDVTLDWDGTLTDVSSKGHFALEVSDTNLAAATYVQDNSQVIPGCDLEVITQSESGVTTEIYQWLSVATSGLLPGTYKGDYTVEISTR